MRSFQLYSTLIFKSQLLLVTVNIRAELPSHNVLTVDWLRKVGYGWWWNFHDHGIPVNQPDTTPNLFASAAAAQHMEGRSDCRCSSSDMGWVSILEAY
jgi:hypothetical protein